MSIDRKSLVQKWSAVLEHEALPQIQDQHRKEVTAILLENQQREMAKQHQLTEAPANVGGAGIALGGAGDALDTVAGFDPVLISLVRRATPKMIAFDVCGVQPMAQPTGLIFAMKAKYSTQDGAEALFDEADTDFSGAASPAHSGSGWDPANNTTGVGVTTAVGETMGDGSGPDFNEMAMSIERVGVTAKTRKLKAEYSLELAQDMKAVHGLDAEAELSNILSTEITSEINREIIRTIYSVAKPGAVSGTTTTAGTFDLDVDANGRWSVEKFKGLMFQIEREANAIGQQTRRGRGNFIICSADVASALAMAGVLDYTPALASNNLNVDDTSTTFAGVLNGKYKVYVDPYTANLSATQFFVVGYKGASATDAGLFYAPYVPLQMMRAVDPGTFQPKIAFQTRYGLVANPFSTGNADVSGALTADANVYYRKVKVLNIM